MSIITIISVVIRSDQRHLQLLREDLVTFEVSGETLPSPRCQLEVTRWRYSSIGRSDLSYYSLENSDYIISSWECNLSARLHERGVVVNVVVVVNIVGCLEDIGYNSCDNC